MNGKGFWFAWKWVLERFIEGFLGHFSTGGPFPSSDCDETAFRSKDFVIAGELG